MGRGRGFRVGEGGKIFKVKGNGGLFFQIVLEVNLLHKLEKNTLTSLDYVTRA